MKSEKSQHGREIVPAPPRDLEIGEVGPPELVGRRGLVPEFLGRFDDDVSRAGDKIVRFQKPIDRRLRDKIFCLVREAHRQFPRAELGLIQRQVDNLTADGLWNPVPDAIRGAIREGLRSAALIAIVPAVER